jgi:hypothetical protein
MEPTQAIAAQPARPQHGPTIPWLPLFAFLILVVYPLSSGPIFKLEEKGIIPHEACDVYLPLVFAADHNRLVGEFFIFYVGKVWKVEPPLINK